MSSQQQPQQLSLQVHLNDESTFDNFYAPQGENNAQVVASLKNMLQPFGETSIFIWGASGVGLTHLLQAASSFAEQQGAKVQYLPLTELSDFSPAKLFEGLDDVDLVCLDGLHAVIGKPSWEQAIFHLFNRLRDSGKRLLMAAEKGPLELPIGLPDLHSRLSWGLVYQVTPLDDLSKQAALQMRAKGFGLELTDEVAQYILHRAPRDMKELFLTLKRLDHVSLAEQRRLTIPFVKQVLRY